MYIFNTVSFLILWVTVFPHSKLCIFDFRQKNPMKIYFLFALFIMCSLCDAQIVNIPDPIFKNALVNNPVADFDGDGIPDGDVDTDNDGEIQFTEAEAVLGLGIVGYNFTSMEGIERFTSLVWLICHSNQLTALDVSQNTNLEVLTCFGNPMTSLELQNPNLIELTCGDNFLTSLDVSGSPNLQSLRCERNLLTSLDLRNNPDLQVVDCWNNKLNSLELNNPSLRYLNCNRNQLTSLNVSQSLELADLYCVGNSLSNLNLSNNIDIVRMSCIENELSFLNIKNGNNLNMSLMYSYDNPNLLCINVDDEDATRPVCDIPTSGWCKDATASYGENCVLGIANFTTKNLILYPNPTSGMLNISTSSTIRNVRIYSSNGNKLSEVDANGIDLTSFPSGIYFIEILGENEKVIRKIIKE